MRTSLPSDITLFLDTYLQLLIAPEDADPIFRTIILLLCHLGQFLHQAMASTSPASSPCSTPLQRLLNTKELGYLFLHLASSQLNYGKIVGIAKMIMSFCENALPIPTYELTEQERITGLLAIKVRFIETLIVEYDAFSPTYE